MRMCARRAGRIGAVLVTAVFLLVACRPVEDMEVPPAHKELPVAEAPLWPQPTTAVGCLLAGEALHTFVLTTADETLQRAVTYQLVGATVRRDAEELRGHLGHTVEVYGRYVIPEEGQQLVWARAKAEEQEEDVEEAAYVEMLKKLDIRELNVDTLSRVADGC